MKTTGLRKKPKKMAKKWPVTIQRKKIRML